MPSEFVLSRNVMIIQQVILDDKHEALSHSLESLYLVMELNKYSLGGHLPVYAIAPPTIIIFPDDPCANNGQKTLARPPHRAGRVQCLELNSAHVLHSSISSGHENIINATPRHTDLGNYVYFVARFVQRKQMQTIHEHPPVLQQSQRADYDRLIFLAVQHRARSDGDLRSTLPDFDTGSVNKRTLLILDNCIPGHSRTASGRVSE